MINKETYELIDQYFKGTLSDTDKAVFEKQIKEDSQLSEEVALQKMLNELLLEKGLADIRKKVGEDLPAPRPPSSLIKNIILIGIGLLLLSAGIFYFSSDKKVKEKVLISKDKGNEEGQRDPENIDSARKIDKEPAHSDLKKKDTPSSLPRKDTVLFQKDLSEEIREERIENKEEHIIKEVDSVSLIENKIEDMPCPEITFDVLIESSCLGKQTGSIQIRISSIKGGQKPYLYSIAGKDFSVESVNSNLSEGDYSVEIKDHKGCTSKKKVHVSGKFCKETIDYSFNPETETWKFPFHENENGTITIADKSGRIVYTAKVVNGSSREWNGISMNGEMLKTDTYVYIAESDNGEIKQGYITILH